MHYSFLTKIHHGEMEQPVIFMRKHPMLLFGTVSLFLALACAPVAAMMVLGDVVTAWMQGPLLGPAIILLLSLYELFILLLLYGSFMDWYLDIWVVTNERIVDVNQNGVFGRAIAELQLAKVQDVSVEQRGVIATMFGYGTIRVQSAGEKALFEFDGISHPQQISKHIIELVQADTQFHREALANAITGE